VLDLVEVRRLAEEGEELVLPGIAEHGAEVADRPEVGIAREDLLDGPRIVGIDEERLLLRLRPLVEVRLRYRRVRVQHGLQRRPVLREARVVDARGVAVLGVPHVLLEQVVPRPCASGRRPRRPWRRRAALRQGGPRAHQSSPWPSRRLVIGTLVGQREELSDHRARPASPRVQSLNRCRDLHWPSSRSSASTLRRRNLVRLRPCRVDVAWCRGSCSGRSRVASRTNSTMISPRVGARDRASEDPVASPSR
jgi:hypothetical protein